LRKYWWIIPIVLILIVGAGYYLCQPRYKIIEATRSLSWDDQPSGFIMSPAKIEVTNLTKWFPLTIPVKITNSAGDMEYNVKFQDPSIFDKGYKNADNNDRYSYTWNEDSLNIKNNTSEVVDITIKKNSLFGTSGIEKGIAISQVPTSGSGNVNFNFSYIFEVLIK
jgi:hypothetical protein